MASKSKIGELWYGIQVTVEGIKDTLQSEMDKAASQLNADKLKDEIEESVSKGYSEGAKEGSESAGETVRETTEKSTHEGAKKGSGGGLLDGLKGAKGALAGVIASLGIGALIADQVGEGIANISSDNKLTTQLALDPQEAERVSGVVDSLFREGWGESRDEINEAMRSILSSFPEMRSASEEALAGMGADVLALAETYGIGVEEISRAGQSFVNNELGTMDEFFNLTAMAYTNLGEAGAADYIDSITEYAGDLKTAGLDATEAFNLFNNAIQAGFYDTDKLMDMIRETGIRVRAGDADEVLDALGMNVDAIKEAAHKGGDAWQEAWQEIMATIAAEGTADDMMQVFGTQSEDLYNQFKNMDWASITADTEAFANSMEQIQENISNDPAVHLESLKREAMGAFQDALVPLLETVLPYLQDFAGWMAENSELVAGIAVVIGGALVAALGAATVGMVAMGAAALANPMTWIVAGIVAGVAALGIAIYALVDNWDAVADAAGAAWDWIMDGISWVGDGLGSIGDSLLSWFKDGLNGIIWILNNIIDGLNWIAEAMVDTLTFSNTLGKAADFLSGGRLGWDVEAPDIPHIPHLYTGAEVIGPTLAIVGDNPEGEYVINRGQMNRTLAEWERRLQVEEQQAGNVTNYITVQPAPGMDERQLADRVLREFEWRMRR